MMGTIVNVLTIIIGGLIGLALKEGLPKRFSDTIMHGLALCIVFIGIEGTFKSSNILLTILSIAIGAVLGELMDIDKLLKKFGDSLEQRFKNSKSKISEGFVAASLLYCVGSMAIVGSLESGLTGNHQTLFVKSLLDGVSSIVFASTLGFGVLLSSITVFLYQGAITMGSTFLKQLLDPAVKDMTAVGSLLIMGLGLNMLGVTKIKVANLLPAVIIPIIYFPLRDLVIRLLPMLSK
jgi:uncharacterized protein